MQTTAALEDLDRLGMQLQALLDDIPLGIQCSLKDEKLIVLGQHVAGTLSDPKQTLRILERKIQSLQLRFTQQVRLYLRIAGQQYPYAYRYFVIQPPPPPPNPILCQAAPGKTDKWVIPSDDELDALMQELMAPVYEQLEPTHSYHDLELIPVEHQDASVAAVDGTEEAIAFFAPADVTDIEFIPERAENNPTGSAPWKSGKVIFSASVAALGVTGVAYGLSQPCVVGACSELTTAQSLNQQSTQVVQTAQDKDDLETARHTLNQAIATLDTIPMWSSRSTDARALIRNYESQGRNLDNIIAVEAIAAAATEKTQTSIYSLEDWRKLYSLWQTAVNQLEKVAPESEFYDYAQRKLHDYRTILAETEYRLQQEETAQNTLDIAKQTIQLAETRRQIAQSPENWQLVQANWTTVIERLQSIPADTFAAVEAQRLLTAYQPELVKTRDRLDHEQTAATVFGQAQQQAQLAQLAFQQSDRQLAVVLWQQAIQAAAQVPTESIYRTQAEALINTYQQAIVQARQPQTAAPQVATALAQVCNHQLQACTLMAVGSSIQVRLNPAYVQAITTARESGNPNLQAMFYQHQVQLKHGLESLANQFRLPVEVYDPSNVMLARHTPQ
jgi:hypothetical protein